MSVIHGLVISDSTSQIAIFNNSIISNDSIS